MRDFIAFLSKFLLALLGIGVVSCDGGGGDMRVEYGCPYADFRASGTVTDEDGKPIQGIRVVLKGRDHQDPEYPRETDTVWTDHYGDYRYNGGERFLDQARIAIEFEDVDGPENGGEFSKVEVNVPIVKVEEGESWYMGAYEASADVTMYKKE